MLEFGIIRMETYMHAYLRCKIYQSYCCKAHLKPMQNRMNSQQQRAIFTEMCAPHSRKKLLLKTGKYTKCRPPLSRMSTLHGSPNWERPCRCAQYPVASRHPWHWINCSFLHNKGAIWACDTCDPVTHVVQLCTGVAPKSTMATSVDENCIKGFVIDLV